MVEIVSVLAPGRTYGGCARYVNGILTLGLLGGDEISLVWPAKDLRLELDDALARWESEGGTAIS